jgi:uncharacterized membrane protein YeaQ/YmgE (transglycosylase-associated protein family)
MTILQLVVFGILIGALARMIRAPKEGGGWVPSIVAGVSGAALAGIAGQTFGVPQHDAILGFALPLLGAFAAVFAYHALSLRHERAHPPPNAGRVRRSSRPPGP